MGTLDMFVFLGVMAVGPVFALVALDLLAGWMQGDDGMES